MDKQIETIAGEAVDAAVRLHMRVGPGLLESVYETLLAKELRRRGLRVEQQRNVPVVLDGVRFEKSFRADLIVGDEVLIEVKAADLLLPTHWRQVLTYLQLLDLRLGFLINFGEARLRDGLKRVVNRYDGFADSRLRVSPDVRPRTPSGEVPLAQPTGRKNRMR